MDAYFVRVLTDILVGMDAKRAVCVWVACAESAEQAVNIVAKRIANGRKVQGVNPAPKGTAEHFGLSEGSARLL
jgi:hypothetical protein